MKSTPILAVLVFCCLAAIHAAKPENPCKFGKALKGTEKGTLHHCGRGGEPCPKTHFCEIDPADRFAVCCKYPKCAKEAAENKDTEKRVPHCDKNGKYVKRQCDDEVCWCVKPKSGKPALFKKKFPRDEKYDCAKKPTKCQKERFSKLVADPDDASAPECDADGNPIDIPEGCRMDVKEPTCENMALGRRTMQSSVYAGNAYAGRAVDGNMNGLWSGNSCACTLAEKNPWWVVDLGRSRMVWRADITNRKDCCHDRLNFIVLGVSDSSPLDGAPSINNYPQCNYYDGEYGAGETKAFKCMKKGRYFIVQLKNDKQYLTMCEVKVYAEKFDDEIKLENSVPEGCRVDEEDFDCENVAPGKMTYQSSVYSSQGYSGRAIDGDASPEWAKASCMHTNSDTNPWWAVDMGKERQVYAAAITNRAESSTRLRNVLIGTTDTSPVEKAPALNNFDVCYHDYGNWEAGQTKKYPCLNKGRYFILQMEQKNFLHVCEVEVFAETFEEDHYQDKLEFPEGCGIDVEKPTCPNVALNLRAMQSSTYQDYAYAGRAVDGTADGMWAHKSLSCTALQENPWWALDLEHEKLVYWIAITNRKDCCEDRFRYARIGVSDSSPEEIAPALTNFKLCNTFDGLLGKGETKRFLCGRRGRYLIIQLQHKQYLTMAEVQVHAEVLDADLEKAKLVPLTCKAATFDAATCKNIALGRAVYQSSVWRNTEFAYNAVDGNPSGVFSAGSCACTNAEAAPWWAMNLGGERTVYAVKMYNRADCCGDRLENINIGLTDKNPTEVAPVVNENYEVCSRYYGQTEQGGTRFMECGGKGEYLIIQLDTDKPQYLTLCEVEVYAEELESDKAYTPPEGCELDNLDNPTCSENLAKGKETMQSSIYGNTAVSGRAVDGIANGLWSAGSCACTNKEEKAWWSVDLEATTTVYRVDILNRKDCCPERLRYFVIGTTDDDPSKNKPNLNNYDVCARNSAPIKAGAWSAHACGTKGRYVVIQQIYTDYLTMCEVRVYAEKVERECASQLTPGDDMEPGDKLCSPNKEYFVELQRDGNLVVYKASDRSVQWATNKLGEGHRLVYQAKDRNLVIYKDNKAIWATDRPGSGGKVIMQDDGNLVVYDADNKPLWASKDPCNKSALRAGESMKPGDKLCSPNKVYFAILQNDGNFVIYKTVDGKRSVEWATNKQGEGHRLAYQRDGNVVIYGPNNAVVWAANKQGSPSRLVMQDDGNLVDYDVKNNPLWASRD